MSELSVDEVMGGGYAEGNYSDVIAARSGLYYEQLGAYPGRTELVRLEHSLERAISAIAGGRVYRDSSDADNQCSIIGLDVLYRGAVVSIAGAINIPMSGGDGTYYLYADPVALSFTATLAGWPTTPCVRLGTIVLSSGTWDWSSFTEFRHQQDMRIVAEPLAPRYDQADHAVDATLAAADANRLHTNIGASGLVTLTMPTPAKGLVFPFVCDVAAGLKLKAQTGHTIRLVGIGTSASGGFVKSTVAGSSLVLVAIDSSRYTLLGQLAGTWTVDA